MFGRGYGEAICAHLGGGSWVVVDSCLHPSTGRPAALAYLESLGVVAAESVVLVLVTHWDDDHIQGIAAVVDECRTASVACSAALGRKD